MAAVKTRHTRPEIAVQRLLRKLGYRFRVHSTGLPGNPDIVFSRRKRVIFVHGCFWHGHKNCKKSIQPKANAAFWKNKIKRNRARDIRVKRKLNSMGWKAIEIWTCRIGKSALERRIIKFLK